MTYAFCPRCATPLHRAVHGERERTACPACAWVHWNNPLPVVAALIEYEDKILLARNAAWPGGMFALITGFLEADETPEQGLAREVKEETNLDCDHIELLGVYEFTRKNEVIIGYHARASGAIQLSEELAEYRLVAPEKLKPWPFGTGLAMAEWLKRRNIPFEFLDMGTVKKTMQGQNQEPSEEQKSA